VDLWACVSVAALPLQLLLRREPTWAQLPVVVVSEDKPQGAVLSVNAKARAAGVLTGQSYAVALSLAKGLHAGVVSETDVTACTDEINGLLWKFSPHVEVSDEPGVFWLDASGLSGLYPSFREWSLELCTQLSRIGLLANVVVGFSRFGTYALARSTHESRVLESAAQEQAALSHVPLVRLDMAHELRDVLAKLGVHTVGALLQLPSLGLLKRFGKNAERLHAMAAGELFSPLQETPWCAPLRAHTFLDEAETDSTRLLFVQKRLLDAVIAQLVVRGQALSSIDFTLVLDRKQGVIGPETLRPATPSLDVVQLMDLMRLRIETLNLAAGVIEVALEATGVPTTHEQLRVFAEQPKRDLEAGARALARLRAELGDDAVVRAVLCPGHLPEAGFGFQPLTGLRIPVPLPSAADTRSVDPSGVPSCVPSGMQASLARRPLIRRIYKKVETLHARPRNAHDDGWLIRGPLCGPITHMAGPYVVSGGWWVRNAHREYYFVLTRRGDLLWVYHDQRRGRFFLHGEVQ
jgi:protein ImuB